MKRVGSKPNVGRLATAVVAATLILTPQIQSTPASAFKYTGEFPTFEKLYYKVDNSFWTAFGSAGVDALHNGDRIWTPQYMGDRLEIRDWGGTNQTNNQIWVENPFPSNQNGYAYSRGTNDSMSPGCYGSNSSCDVIFNKNARWDYDNDGTVTYNAADMWSVAGHEFGHWIGAYHPFESPGQSPILTDNRRSIMDEHQLGVAHRYIVQDDANAFYASRPDKNWNGYVANPSFEGDQPFWGWGFNGGNPWLSLPAGAYYPAHGQRFLKLRGPANVSTYQDMEPRGGYWNGRPLRLMINARAAQAQNVNLTIWSLNHNQNVNGNCFFPGDSQWHVCWLGPMVPWGNDTRLRFEIYKQGTGELDIDVVAVSPA